MAEDSRRDIQDVTFPERFIHRTAAIQQHDQGHIGVCNRAEFTPEAQINLRHRQPTPARHNLIPNLAESHKVRV